MKSRNQVVIDGAIPTGVASTQVMSHGWSDPAVETLEKASLTQRASEFYLDQYPENPISVVAWASGSVHTLTRAGLPLFIARSMAGRISSGFSTNSP